MTTDLRAALRDTATAWDALGTRAAMSDRHPLVNPDHCEARAKHLRALADAPPTVEAIFVVIKTTGEYSDRSDDAVCWFPTESEAIAHVEKLTAEYKPELYDYDAPRFCYWQIERGQVTP